MACHQGNGLGPPSRTSRARRSVQPHRAHAPPSCDHRLGRNDGRGLQRGRARLLDAQDRRPRQHIHPVRRHGGLGPRCNAAARSRATTGQSAVASLSGQACACVARRCRCGGTCDRRSDRGPARQSGHDLLPREREISASPAARASPGRGPARSRRGVRFHCDGVEAQGTSSNSCSRRSLRRRSSTIATPATRPRPTGSCCPRCSGVPEYRCTTARCRNGRRSPIARWRWGRASPHRDHERLSLAGSD